ncbi:hypothetical protein PM10SUCC1_19230 [Propionigenium maris DSM 9537]|uniref:Uncharacterized protein n=1 Tax=Propionigenium maris DSM 9537 TaxID=1123000 RepID=A0A9W6GJP9_9FUSO|nr:hypothetical protein [Propionigenium maris]GLI56409.1 hypothetical protein PM10SUCC1_19230 [Propionigenium maris DSM 9537]
MNITESKELAEKLTGKEVEEEAIEGIYLGIEELPERISMILEGNDEDFMAYLNPIDEDKVVIHVLSESEEVLVSYLADEAGSVEEVYHGTKGMEQGSHMGS